MSASRFRTKLRACLMAVVVTTPLGVLADDAPYSQDQIVQALIASVDLGTAQAVCIGTKSDCNTPDRRVELHAVLR